MTGLALFVLVELASSGSVGSWESTTYALVLLYVGIMSLSVLLVLERPLRTCEAMWFCGRQDSLVFLAADWRLLDFRGKGGGVSRESLGVDSPPGTCVLSPPVEGRRTSQPKRLFSARGVLS